MIKLSIVHEEYNYQLYLTSVFHATRLITSLPRLHTSAPQPWFIGVPLLKPYTLVAPPSHDFDMDLINAYLYKWRTTRRYISWCMSVYETQHRIGWSTMKFETDLSIMAVAVAFRRC